MKTETRNTEPIAVEASATLDYTTNPERPVSIEVELPSDVVDDAQAAVEAVRIRATLDSDDGN